MPEEEYTETKTRVYAAKKVKNQSKFSKYFVKPITKAMGMKEGDGNSKRGRLTA